MPNDPCRCPLCDPARWVKGKWIRDEKPIPDGLLCPTDPIHREGVESYYVKRVSADPLVRARERCRPEL